jgi:hypothetical protein
VREQILEKEDEREKAVRFNDQGKKIKIFYWLSYSVIYFWISIVAKSHLADGLIIQCGSFFGFIRYISQNSILHKLL